MCRTGQHQRAFKRGDWQLLCAKVKGLFVCVCVCVCVCGMGGGGGWEQRMEGGGQKSTERKGSFSYYKGKLKGVGMCVRDG